MNPEQINTMRRALGLAVQILEDMPEWLRPESNMRDIRRILAGESTGRDSFIMAEAIAIAIAWRTVSIVESPPVTVENADVNVSRLHEFRDLFAAAWCVDSWSVAISYAGMCDRLARARAETA